MFAAVILLTMAIAQKWSHLISLEFPNAKGKNLLDRSYPSDDWWPRFLESRFKLLASRRRTLCDSFPRKEVGVRGANLYFGRHPSRSPVHLFPPLGIPGRLFIIGVSFSAFLVKTNRVWKPAPDDPPRSPVECNSWRMKTICGSIGTRNLENENLLKLGRKKTIAPFLDRFDK